MRRNYISPEYKYVTKGGTFNMLEQTSFFGSKMIDIQDRISISNENVIYYQNSNFEQLNKEHLYYKIRQSDYDSTGYLEGVSVVNCHYKELFLKYNGQNNIVFLVDPPYLSTDVSTYSNKEYWRLTDYLDVLEVLVNNSYFYFTSNKSSILELFSWLELHYGADNPFIGATKKIQNVGVTHNAKYQDIMLYKFNTKKQLNEYNGQI